MLQGMQRSASGPLMGKGPDKGLRTMDGRTLLDGTTSLLLKVNSHLHLIRELHQENHSFCKHAHQMIRLSTNKSLQPVFEFHPSHAFR